MKIGMNADWARFKTHGIRTLGRAGFADWMEHAAAVVRTEAKREAANAAYLAAHGAHVRIAAIGAQRAPDSTAAPHPRSTP